MMKKVVKLMVLNGTLLTPPESTPPLIRQLFPGCIYLKTFLMSLKIIQISFSILNINFPQLKIPSNLNTITMSVHKIAWHGKTYFKK